MTRAIPCDLAEVAGGYIIIAPVSDTVKQAIATLQNQLIQALPPGSLWLPAADELHITFAHVVTSNVQFDRPKDELFAERREQAIAALQYVADTTNAIPVLFDTITAFPSAIIITARDDGSYDRARDDFAGRCEFPDGSRKPPTIIHSTIARFLKPVPMEDVERIVADLSIHVRDMTTELWLIQEQQIFVQEYQLLETFTLK